MLTLLIYLFIFLFGIIMPWSQSRMVSLLGGCYGLIYSVRFWFSGGSGSCMFFS